MKKATNNGETVVYTVVYFACQNKSKKLTKF